LRTRDEHLAWAKERAREYLDRGDVVNAIASMGSDLSQHPELKEISFAMMPVGMFFAANGDLNEARRWVEGFR
jgi:hypothetical protein